MITSSSVSMKPGQQELVITRIFDAPRELVFKAWTDPEHLKQWWGPKDFTSPACKLDLRVGGAYHFCMRGPDGKDYWSTGIYKEIVAPERIVYTDSFADEAGNVVPASYYGLPGDDYPLEMLVSVTFEEFGNKTKMMLQHIGLPAGDRSELEVAGWNQSFDKLNESLG